MIAHLFRIPAAAVLCWLMLLSASPAAQAHAYSPATLTLTEISPTEFVLGHKMPATTPSAAVFDVALDSCTPSPWSAAQHLGSDILRSQRLHCVDVPRRLTLSAPSERLHIVRILRRGQPESSQVLPAGAQELTLVTRQQNLAGVLRDFFISGFQHMAIGFDHLCLVALLVLLLKGRRLIFALTAFTVGHSMSLALSSATRITLPAALIEPAIAASILYLALQLAHRQREPQASAPPTGGLAGYVAIGLLHGLGFSAVLREVGLPPFDFMAAVLAFNLGIEAAQVTFVLALLLLWRALAHWQAPLQRLAAVPAYLVGGLSFAWILERIA